ncbi:MAG: DUF1697 domain-containing protein [Chloroflexales bacterium]|nr:DUF1697 domain-containing protein [Chloroflexales bacterium]
MAAVQIALLRGINVGGQNKLAMAELRACCAELGWQAVQTYIQSGNLVFQADGPVAHLEAALEQRIAERLGLTIPVIVRGVAAWAAYVPANPYPDASRDAPERVMLALAKAPPKEGAAAALRARAANGEQITQVGDALWVYYPEGAGRSKLTPALFDRMAGAPVTARNWRTVLKLAALAEATGHL